MKNIGFVGLGIMGRPMARHLTKTGCTLYVNDVNESAVADLEELGALPSTLAEMGKCCDIIFLSLPSAAVCREVLCGEGGILASLRAGALIIDTSSNTPVEAREFAGYVQACRAGYIDCPVSGGETGATSGTLAFMAGGSQEDFDRAYPYFRAMGESALLVGTVGSGSIAKLANQVIVNMTIAAVSEALVLATKAGADPERVYEAIRGGLAGSAVLDAKAPMMYTRNFTPGGRISINHKDIGNVLLTAHAADVPMPMTSQLFEILQSLKVAGHMNDDHSGIVQYFEKLANVTVEVPKAAE